MAAARLMTLMLVRNARADNVVIGGVDRLAGIAVARR
jgi:hypothetical protein